MQKKQQQQQQQKRIPKKPNFIKSKSSKSRTQNHKCTITETRAWLLNIMLKDIHYNTSFHLRFLVGEPMTICICDVTNSRTPTINQQRLSITEAIVHTLAQRCFSLTILCLFHSDISNPINSMKVRNIIHMDHHTVLVMLMMLKKED